MGDLLEWNHLKPGDHLGRYELLAVLAQGGMGSVWLARMTGMHGFERLVALKTILPLHSADPKFRSMFLDEARIASRIHHENVVAIQDIGEERGMLYFAMEYVEGESLKRFHKAAVEHLKQFPLAIALGLVRDACAGLHTAHDLLDDNGDPLGVVHRDVSPQNVIITPNGTAKIIDFGIARARDRLSQATESGTLKGKVNFMSPEQARGDDVDRRADVYALGAILYYLVSGKLAHDAADGSQLAALHSLMTGARPAPLSSEVPQEVRALIDTALSHEPMQRYATAEDMRAAIVRVMASLHLACAPADVAQLYERTLGGRLLEKRAAIKDAMQLAKRRIPKTDSPLLQSSPSVSVPGQLTTAAGTAMNTQSTADLPASNGRKTWGWAFGGMIIGTSIAVAGFVMAERARSHASVHPPVAASDTVTTTALAPTSVSPPPDALDPSHPAVVATTAPPPVDAGKKPLAPKFEKPKTPHLTTTKVQTHQTGDGHLDDGF